jgi:glutathione synthase/RimK-type ligase-like ATP-grasp enzyme
MIENPKIKLRTQNYKHPETEFVQKSTGILNFFKKIKEPIILKPNINSSTQK